MKKINVVIDDEAHRILVNFKKRHNIPTQDVALEIFLKEKGGEFAN